MKGVTIVLMKGYNGKSRLSLPQDVRVKLIDALTKDLYKSVSETNLNNGPWDCFIATPDSFLSKKCKKEKIPILKIIPGQLNYVFTQLQNWAVENDYDAIILCAGDIPLIHNSLIGKIKEKLILGLKEKGKSMVVCPSKSNGVSIIAMSPANLWMITEHKGKDNLNVIKNLDRNIYPYQILDDDALYLDLDNNKDLITVWAYMELNPTYANRLVKEVLYEFLICSYSAKANLPSVNLNKGEFLDAIGKIESIH